MDSIPSLPVIHRPIRAAIHGVPFLIVLALLAFPSHVPAQQSATPFPVYSSDHFHVMTDLSEEESKELLERLETMLSLVTDYFGRPLPNPIEMVVVKDIKRWPENSMPEDAYRMVAAGAGITMGVTTFLGDDFVNRSTVYAIADRGTPQHEAVHAYCAQAFGRTGPVWYSEGMAECGNYWKQGEKAVLAPDYIINYLKSDEPKTINAIVNNPLERSGDSWKNYAWRWALCHMLGFNENYSPRFKSLGLNLLNGKDIKFESVYGNFAQEMEFEYSLFLKNLTHGYRVDLCSWDWKTRCKLASKTSITLCKIDAQRGWQCSKLRLKSGTEYEFLTEGTWTVDEKLSEDLTADGNSRGEGKLVAIILKDYALSEPFDLSAGGKFTASQDGDLYLRAQEDWGKLADNQGKIQVRIKLASNPAALDKSKKASPAKNKTDDKKTEESDADASPTPPPNSPAKPAPAKPSPAKPAPKSTKKSKTP